MSEYIPHEVITDILAWLPVKSLLRFRCVCREWLALISSSPDFISRHLSHSSSSPDRALVCHSSESLGGPFYFLYNDDTFTVKTTAFTRPDNRDSWVEVGYCNGVLCLRMRTYNGRTSSYPEGTFILWNPSIRRAISVPSPRLPKLKYGFYTYASGFGFDSVSNDYKIVKITYCRPICYDFPPKVEVFSLSVGEWRLIESNVTGEFGISSYSWQAVKDNVLHWIGYKSEPKCSLIVLFDLSAEIFGEMSLPKPLECENSDYIFVAMLGRLFSVLCYDEFSTDKSCAIWVMKEYGNADSWVNQYNIDIEGGSLIGVLRNNALLVALEDGGLLSYNYEKKTSMVTGICGTKYVLFVGTYVESLVLVDKGREIPEADTESDNEHGDRLV